MTKNICILAGARPNFIKVSPLVRAISQRPEARCLLVYAGSADDPTLEASLFDDLQIGRPQYYLGVVSTSLNEITSQVMAQFDKFLDEHPVDVVIVVDDLASTMAAAIVTKKQGIKLAHIVAGTRSFDIKMPKEINRLVIDGLSDLLFTAGMGANSNATREGAELSKIYTVGNILMDTLRFNRNRLKAPSGLELQAGNYLVFTLNRKALLADRENLRRMIEAMIENAGGMPIIAPLRGKAAETIQEMGFLQEASPMGGGLVGAPPLSYLEFGWLTANARGIITDSGNVAEEATFNGVPCITLNSYTEHIETVKIGTNELVGEDAALLGEMTAKMVRGEWKESALPDRWDGRTAERIVQILMEI